jgi:hypothetical protein
VETNLLNGRTFTSLEHLNEICDALADRNCRYAHAPGNQTPAHRLFEEEKQHLLMLPIRPYDTARVLYRTVDPDGHIAYLQNFYSRGNALASYCRCASPRTN